MRTNEIWQSYLPKARWFQAKGLDARVTRVDALPWYVQNEDCWVRSELAYVDSCLGQETYHLLVGYRPVASGESEALVGNATMAGREWDVLDAPQSPVAMTALLRALVRPKSDSMTWFETPPITDTTTEIFAGEQSNTNVLIGENVLLKVIRKLPEAKSLDVEMLRVLASSGVTPRLYGTLTNPSGSKDLAFFCERIKQATDGWDFATNACRDGVLIGNELENLGTSLRLIHNHLAQVFGVSTVSAELVRTQLLERLNKASVLLPELMPLQLILRRAFDDLDSNDLEIQRLHGDFHLGQTLTSNRGWFIIDFEGEPLKTSSERRAPDSVWRDIAGLIRSLDYVCSKHCDPAGNQAKAWYKNACDGFIRGYGQDSWGNSLLRAYEIDKAVYELVYETRNRPAWASIPRRFLQDATARLSQK